MAGIINYSLKLGGLIYGRKYGCNHRNRKEKAVHGPGWGCLSSSNRATGNEVGLYNELLVKDVESHEYINDGQTTCRYSGTLEAGELSGKQISEMGLYDVDGDLIAYRNFLPKGKDADIPQIYKMDTIF